MIKAAGSWDKNTDTGNLILQTPMFKRTNFWDARKFKFLLENYQDSPTGENTDNRQIGKTNTDVLFKWTNFWDLRRNRRRKYYELWLHY